MKAYINDNNLKQMSNNTLNKHMSWSEQTPITLLSDYTYYG
jgi:hypothetical protein